MTANEERMVKLMLQLDTIRGPHSTGLFGAKVNGDCTIFKKMGNPWEVAEYKGFDKFWQGNYNVLIGHNRWATQGGINHVNAHPFQHGKLYGVHNGTLNRANWKRLLDDSEMFDVDSDNIYHHMSQNGVEDTVKNLDGAFALVWYDEEHQTINMTRNNERTLFFAYSVDRKTLFWASEDWMLSVAADKAGVSLGPINLLKSGILLSVTIEPKYSTGKNAIHAVDDVVVKDLEQYVQWVPPKKDYGVTTPITKYSGNSKPDSSLKKYLGEPILFRVDGLDKDPQSGLEFLDCFLDSDPKTEVRLYHTGNPNIDADKMMTDDHTYRAKVRSYRDQGTGGYMVLDPRNVEIYATYDADGVQTLAK